MTKCTLNELVEILEGKLVDIFINNGISYLSMWYFVLVYERC